MSVLLQLFYEFFKTGLFSIGGGLATLPFLYDIGERTGWFTSSQVIEMIALSESTPGPLGIKMAAYAGFATKGVLGAIVAVVGEVMPAIIIILLIAGFLNAYKDSKYVKAVMHGLRPASTGLIAAAGLSVIVVDILHVDALKSGDFAGVFTWQNLALAVVVFFLTKKFKKLHPVVFIAGCAAIGIAFGAVFPAQ